MVGTTTKVRSKLLFCTSSLQPPISLKASRDRRTPRAASYQNTTCHWYQEGVSSVLEAHVGPQILPVQRPVQSGISPGGDIAGPPTPSPAPGKYTISAQILGPSQDLGLSALLTRSRAAPSFENQEEAQQGPMKGFPHWDQTQQEKQS